MKTELLNNLKITLISKSENEALSRHLISSFLALYDPTIEELADLRTIISEAVTNCIVHAYKGTTGYIYIKLSLYSDGNLHISITDKGCGIDNIALARQPLYTTDKSGERGGMGFAIMESFTDKLKVISKPGKGTTVSMRKKLSIL